MKRKLVLAGAALMAITAWAIWKGTSKDEGRGSRRRTAEAVLDAIEQAVEATGSVVARNRVEIKPPIGGRIEQLLAAEGSTVKAGQLIAWMSSNDRAAILDAARARGPDEYERWKESYKPTPIIAPLSGVVILRNAVVGQTVETGTVLYAMADALIVLAQVDESEIGRVTEGMPARIVLDAYPDRPFEGVVDDILHEGKNVSNVITYGVKVKPREVPSFVRSQMTATVSFIVGRRESALLIPAAAVVETAGGVKQVFLPGPDGEPVAREIKVGVETADRVEVLAGLSLGEKIYLGRGRYVPQQVAASPLAGGSRPGSSSGTGSGGGGSSRRRSR